MHLWWPNQTTNIDQDQIYVLFKNLKEKKAMIHMFIALLKFLNGGTISCFGF